MLLEIKPITCKQFVTQNSPAVVLTIIQLGFTPPFSYMAIGHSDVAVSMVTEPMPKEDIEKYFHIKL